MPTARALVSCLLLVSTLLGCATAKKQPDPPVPMTPPSSDGPGEFAARGELIWKDLTGVRGPRRASWDDWRVKGPTASLTRTAGGLWVGKLRGREVTLAAEAGKVSGGDVDLAITMSDKGVIAAEGRFGGRPVRLELVKDRITAIFPGGTIDLSDMGTGMFNSYQGLLQISGPPDMPQVVIALLDVLVP